MSLVEAFDVLGRVLFSGLGGRSVAWTCELLRPIVATYNLAIGRKRAPPAPAARGPARTDKRRS